MQLSRRQTVALKRSTAPINIWVGAVRSGKTHASIWKFIRVMQQRAQAQKHDGLVLVVGLSTNTVWRNIFIPLLTQKEFAAVAPFVNYRRNAPSGTIFGQEFSVVGASNEASFLSIQGMTVEFCLGDEAVGWPESFWTMLISRLSLEQSQLLVTCNPGSSTHYLKKLIDKNDPDVHAETFLISQNPTLPRAVIDRTKRMYTGVFLKRMIDGQWVAAEGSIYETFDYDTMTIDAAQVPDCTIIAVGIDYGTTHKTRGYALAVGKNNLLYITHEFAPEKTLTGGRSRLTDSEQADEFEQWHKSLPNRPKFIYCDPAAASFREALKRRGYTTNRADNAVVDGIRTVDTLLTNKQLLISRACPELIGEIPSYRWDTKATERGNDAPVKENDDACDALRYTVRSSRHIWQRLITI